VKQIIAVRPETCSGPGWTNRVIWIIERDAKGKLFERCLQHEEQSNEMKNIFDICETAHTALLDSVLRGVK